MGCGFLRSFYNLQKMGCGECEMNMEMYAPPFLKFCIVCSLYENLGSYWESTRSKVFLEWTDYRMEELAPFAIRPAYFPTILLH